MNRRTFPLLAALLLCFATLAVPSHSAEAGKFKVKVAKKAKTFKANIRTGFQNGVNQVRSDFRKVKTEFVQAAKTTKWLLQGSPQLQLAGAQTSQTATSSREGQSKGFQILQMAEHKKNARKSTHDKHTKKRSGTRPATSPNTGKKNKKYVPKPNPNKR